MMPVPSGAGFSMTEPAPKCPSTWCGMVVSVRLTPMQVLLGGFDSLANGLRNFLRLAGTVADDAFTRIADDDERGEGHVLTALDDLGDAIDGDDLILEVEPVRVELLLDCHGYPLCFPGSPWASASGNLELEPGFAGGLGESLDAAVVKIAATIENDLLDALFLSPLGDGILPTSFGLR